METLVEQILPFQTGEIEARDAAVSSAQGEDAVSKTTDGQAELGSDEYSGFSPKLRPQTIKGVPAAPPSHQSSVWALDGKQPVPPPDRSTQIYIFMKFVIIIHNITIFLVSQK